MQALRRSPVSSVAASAAVKPFEARRAESPVYEARTARVCWMSAAACGTSAGRVAGGVADLVEHGVGGGVAAPEDSQERGPAQAA